MNNKNIYKYFTIALVLNALGTALMSKSNLGMSSWGCAISNFSYFLNITLGTGFIVFAVIFFLLSLIILREFNLKNTLESFAFAFSFGFLVDIFNYLLKDITLVSTYSNYIMNIAGLIIMALAISIHLRINFALHPLDVFMRSIIVRLNSTLKGSYISYGLAFTIALLFGYFNKTFYGFGVGTLNTVLFFGYMLSIFNKKVKIKLNNSQV